MSILSDNYKRIMTEIEQKISNEEEKEFVKEKITELSNVFMDVLDNLTEKTDEKIKQIEEKQQQIEEKMAQVEGAVNEIESDIYEEDDENFEFEIVCPYCNYEFSAEIDGRNEIVCPECNNTIELDWNEEDEDGCGGSCSGCHGCSNETEENDDDM